MKALTLGLFLLLAFSITTVPTVLADDDDDDDTGSRITRTIQPAKT